jgi:hypothetical protein
VITAKRSRRHASGSPQPDWLSKPATVGGATTKILPPSCLGRRQPKRPPVFALPDSPHESLDDFNFDHTPALNRDMIAHLGTGAFLAKARNVVLLGPSEAG